MTQVQSIDESPLMIFQGPGFVIQMPTNWLIVNGDDGTIAFIGPTVGKARAGFTLTLEPAFNEDGGARDHNAVAESTKAGQAQQWQNYTVLSEQDISNDAMPAYTRHFHWYNPQIDMVIVQRQVFSTNADYIITLTSSVPNGNHLDEFDRLFLKMISSFQFGHLDL